jgi:transcriptional regulator with XRE-family HTH domain
MGRGARMRPARLAEKLRQIRCAFNETQEEIVKRLGFNEITREYVSGYELGTREPPLPVLLQYARVAGVCVDILIDDEQNLPTKLPNVPKHEGARRTRQT